MCRYDCIFWIDSPSLGVYYQPMIDLRYFPMPPSVNRLYESKRRRIRLKSGGTKLCPTVLKTPEYVAFERAVTQWAYVNATVLQAARNAIRTPGALWVDALFLFPYEDVFTKKDGKPKRLDTSNRLKAFHDALANCLQIDDSRFWGGSFDKAASVSYDTNTVKIKIRKYGQGL